jgi:type II secretory pathway pseudopilin PulG
LLSWASVLERLIARSKDADRGSTLVEVLVATTCLVGALAYAAQVYGVAGEAGRRARRITSATVLAQAKLEELVSTSNDALVVDSPAAALDTDIPGSFDVVDGFVRRWALAALPSQPDAAVVIQVLVLPQRAASTTSSTASGNVRPADGAHLVTIRRRRVS